MPDIPEPCIFDLIRFFGPWKSDLVSYNKQNLEKAWEFEYFQL